MSIVKLHAEAEALEQEAKDAYSTHLKARERQRREHHYAARDVVSGLSSLRDSILYRKGDSPTLEDRPAKERALTIAFCKEIIKREDLVLFPLGNSDALDVRDLSIDRDAAESNVAAVAARKRVRDFESENADGLKAEVDAAVMKRIREALDGNDPDAVRAVLAGKV